MPQLRPYQTRQHDGIGTAWRNGSRYVCATAPTGAGKTVLFSEIIAEHVGAACVIAHRQELVQQISLSLARSGVRHTIIGPRDVIKFITRLHVSEVGQCFYDPAAPIAVAGVDTLIRRGEQLNGWRQQVTLWVLDECHHLLRENKWGAAAELFPNARGLGVTATPCRADGKGLGAHADGVFDVLISGPSMRQLITEGYLTDYRIFVPGSDVDMGSVEISAATGDFKHSQLVAAVRKSHLVGDVVQHYIKHAAGKLGITFVPDVQTAIETAANYNAQGVPAAAISAKTPGATRHHLIERFRRGDLKQLVNVDLFGEGFDLPAIEVVSMARPTNSFPLYTQQFGRALRPMEGKDRATIIDHVDNITRHNGPPDKPRVWSLDRRPTMRRGERDPDIIPVKICAQCTQPFEAIYRICPHCAAEYAPARRDGPQFVEGDLIELDGATLAALRGEAAAIDETPESVFSRMIDGGLPHVAAAGNAKQHRLKQDAQRNLRRMLALYGGLQRSRGRSDSEAYRRFFFRYDIDVLTAQSLKRVDAEQLASKIIHDISRGAA